MAGAGGRGRRIRRRIAAVAVLVALLAVMLAAAWVRTPMRAEAAPLDAVRDDAAVELSDVGDAVVLRPRSASGTGLVFLAGARVDAPAYAWKLSALVDRGVTVVIVRPPLGFALLESRPLAAFEELDPAVDRWFVGGHSLGGVRACQYAQDEDVAGLVLFGSYCAVDLSTSDVAVLSIGGERDGLSTPAKIAAARHLLPDAADLVELPGASHAQFGDYGAQSGDGTPTATDDEVRAGIAAAVLPFAGVLSD